MRTSSATVSAFALTAKMTKLKAATSAFSTVERTKRRNPFVLYESTTQSTPTVDSVISSSSNNEKITTVPSTSIVTDRETYEKSSNGLDPFYPHLFEGRLWFRPAIVSLRDNNDTNSLPSQIVPLSLFNYAVGGTVALEYDVSPDGYYLEYATMGSIVGLNSMRENDEWWKFKKERKIGFGQWGSKLYVSTQGAVDLCQKVWGVPAILGDIQFGTTDSSGLKVEVAPKEEEELGEMRSPDIKLNGWKATQSYENPSQTSSAEEDKRVYLPVLWTPTIKALWFPFTLSLPFFSQEDDDNKESRTTSPPSKTATKLPIHKLRLSVKSAKLHWCPQWPSKELGIPFPVGLSVDGLRIEISDLVDEW
uniref:Uncharacterized protein n=1 Tax=Ditylum brightwellii TaxID=49249 RepID=A0A7S1YTW5_9STRA